MSNNAAASNSYKDGSKLWSSTDGHYRRQNSEFRSSIAKDGEFPPEIGRYHLIVAYACPWAHRTLIVRQLKGIDRIPNLLPVHVVDSYLGAEGWSFVPYEDGLGVPGTGNHVPGHESKIRLREFYKAANPDYAARCTVPIIWDNKTNTIVSNESAEIIRNLNHAFDDLLHDEFKGLSFYPDNLKSDIDALNEWIYDTVNNGVYKCGFASTQQAYDSNMSPLFKSLDRLEQLLSDGRQFLLGGQLTEADIRLYTTLARFDPVYVGHFKCNINTIRAGYPRLHDWLRRLYWNNEAFNQTTHFDSIKAHYYQSHTQINPTRIVPLGPLPHILPLDK